MAGTREGGLKAMKANKERQGEDWYSRIGRIGGKRCVPKGFSMNIERAKEAGRKGGKISRRGKAKKSED